MDSRGSIGVRAVNAVLLRLPVLKELEGDLVEQCVGQNVLLLLHQPLRHLGAERFHLRLEIVGGTIGDRLGGSADLLHELGLDGHRRLAVLAQHDVLELLGNGLVALAGQHIENSLRADNLGRGRNQRYPTSARTRGTSSSTAVS